MQKDQFYIVNKESLPEVFIKVMKVKEMILLGKAKDVSTAIKIVGISRSTYYKYKDNILHMDERFNSKKLTFIISISDKAGTLSKVLDCIAFYKCNIITINQDIPISLSANVTITIDISYMEKSTNQLEVALNGLKNVISVKLLKSE